MTQVSELDQIYWKQQRETYPWQSPSRSPTRPCSMISLLPTAFSITRASSMGWDTSASATTRIRRCTCSRRREDLAVYDLDSNALTLRERRPYNERFIHGEIYKARPDVHSVVHCHTPALLTFCVCQTPLRPLYHMSGFLGRGVARFEIREVAGMTDMLCSTPQLGAALAKSLADKQIVLMRGHGATMAGQSIKHSVFRALYAALNATMQMDAMRLGEVTYLADEEAMKGMEINDRFIDRSWSLWKHEAMGPS